jgi:predicted kinase
MKSGLPVILDATNLSRVGKYYTLASEYGYEVVVVDFKVSLDVLKERNLHRGIANVPVDVVEKMYEKKRTTEIHSGSRVISPTDFKREWREVVSQISKN